MVRCAIDGDLVGDSVVIHRRGRPLGSEGGVEQAGLRGSRALPRISVDTSKGLSAAPTLSRRRRSSVATRRHCDNMQRDFRRRAFQPTRETLTGAVAAKAIRSSILHSAGVDEWFSVTARRQRSLTCFSS
jgi:hypothetical protein